VANRGSFRFFELPGVGEVRHFRAAGREHLTRKEEVRRASSVRKKNPGMHINLQKKEFPWPPVASEKTVQKPQFSGPDI